ncbi:MAG: DNA topoisomerase VI subunit B [Candidatus Diapherotrites archaeon]|nr:DNA topoisomerase VI subunit B [Candidatus Diapherotrites archaeon]
MPEKKVKEKDTEEELLSAAKNLDGQFKEHSVAEFFKKNKQMLGLYGKVRTLTMVVHEYVTNSLDACEETGILPNIDVKIDELGEEYYEVTVTDNGPGISQENVGKAFGKLLAGTKFHRMMQSRGQQGIGAAGCTMLSQMTTGKASKVITGRGNGKAISLELTIDPKMNEPKITNLKELEKEFKGTAIQAKFKGTLYRDSDQGPLEYLRRTAIANPHAQLSFRDPSGQKFIFKRSHNQNPERPEEIKPHPKGTTVDDILSYCKTSKGRTVATFLSNDFDRMGAKGIDEVKKRVRFDMNKDPKTLNWEESEEIIKAFKAIDFIAPSTDALRPIGEDQIRKSLQSIVQPEFLTVLTRKPAVYAGGYPFQVEIAIAYGGNAGKKAGEQTQMEIMRFANRVPLLFDAGNCALTKAIQTIDWKRYDIKDPETAPVTVFVNFISVHIPYTGAGKQAIADEEEVLEEIRLALMQTGRKAGIYIAHKRREAENQQKREMFYKYIPEICKAFSAITKSNESEMRKNMEKLVLQKLKLEEAKDAEEKARVDKVLKEDDNSFITKPKAEKAKETKEKGK